MTSSPNGARSEVLTFRLGKEEYGIDILKVQEIRGYEATTAIANAPDFLKGVINLRGEIVPIIDMRIRFRLSAPSYDQFTVVIILRVQDTVVGIVVDAVSDVVALAGDQVKPAPEMTSAIHADYICGLGTVGERMLILVDIDKLLASELGLAKKLAA
ncbi:MAG TPA: chemotaxis protein CheW [Noviherbaspirillum sp.]|uniref:chemotaxis protein CheW n=1 Tax=Noviherbaspirillum sp. TaxID=1926288 RepID=UPI002D41FE97|nr:chemotaxis protein CheW [Noviherbaspirillum sp.]HYD94500.1 chemotaxis protein CheW [Noviherbaspirillum sp.]